MIRRIVCFDGESNGLHGEVFAVGGVALCAATGREESTFYARAPNPQELDPWVAQNVIPHLTARPTHKTPGEMRDAFWKWLGQATGTGAAPETWVVVDCGWPVEARLLEACVGDDPEGRAFKGPYPLHELATLLAAARRNPMAAYAGEVLSEEELENYRPHHPVWDARVSARAGLLAARALRLTPGLTPGADRDE